MRYDPPFQRTLGLVPVLCIVALLLVLPLFVQGSFFRHLMVLAFIYAVVAASWDLSFGYGGLLNFAHVALFAVGIYAYGILAKTYGVNPWLAVLLAGFAAAFFASVMMIPVLRLDGMYIILVTIAFTQILYQGVISQSDITGGTSGMVTLPALSIDGYRLTKNQKIGYYYVGLSLLISCTAALYLITRSALGRTIVALRDNKYYARSRGISEWKTRLATLTISAFFAGIAGGFYGSYVRVASPDIFGIGSLTLILSILLVGGIGTLWGPILAAFLITLVSELLSDLGPWREIVVAASIIVVMVFYPGGLWGMVQEIRESLQTLNASLRSRLNRARERHDRQKRRVGIPEQLIETEHGLIAIADSGADPEHSGPPILFIHGNSACKEAFLYQFRHFKGKRRMITFDLPGHGVSSNGDPEKTYNVPAYAEVAKRVLTHCDVQKPVLVGWSLGGYIALEVAAQSPAKYAGIVITGTSPLTIAPDDFARGHNARSHLILAGKQYLTHQESEQFASSATAPLSSESAFMHRNLHRTDGRARYYMITKLTVVNWPRQMQMLRNGKLPVAVINGADDPFLNHRYIAELPFGNLWGGQPIDIPNGLHAPFFNKPQAFNTELEKFLDYIKANPCTDV